MSSENYKEMYFYYKARCEKLEAFLSSTSKSMETLREELKGNAAPDQSFSSTQSLQKMVRGDSSDGSVQYGAGAMWVEEEKMLAKETSAWTRNSTKDSEVNDVVHRWVQNCVNNICREVSAEVDQTPSSESSE